MSELHRDDSDLEAWRVAAIGAERSYIVETHTWIVCEVIDPVTLEPVLIFTSDGVGRRVRHYPVKWRDLTSEQLHALSWST